MSSSIPYKPRQPQDAAHWVGHTDGNFRAGESVFLQFQQLHNVLSFQYPAGENYMALAQSLSADASAAAVASASVSLGDDPCATPCQALCPYFNDLACAQIGHPLTDESYRRGHTELLGRNLRACRHGLLLLQ